MQVTFAAQSAPRNGACELYKVGIPAGTKKAAPFEQNESGISP
jgi:hypothetical protein